MRGAAQHKIDENPHGVLKLPLMARQKAPTHHDGHFI